MYPWGLGLSIFTERRPLGGSIVRFFLLQKDGSGRQTRSFEDRRRMEIIGTSKGAAGVGGVLLLKSA